MEGKGGTNVAGEAEIVLTRVIAAPRERVFRAWTEADQLKRWRAPKGFTTPHCTVDLCPGGVFHCCLRSPEGQDVWGIGRYRKIVRPERLVYVDSFADAKGDPVPPSHYGAGPLHPAESLVTVTFLEAGGATNLTLRHAIPSSAPKHEGAQTGWSQMLDRLAQHVEVLK